MLVRFARRGFSYLFLSVLAFTFLLPFFWMVSTALKSPAEVFSIPLIWVPRPPVWGNIVEGWFSVNFSRFMLNTLFITVAGTLGTMITSAIVAYGFARFPCRWNTILFTFVLATLMLPSQILLIPSFILFARIGWVNTFIPLILPAWLGGGAFNIFLLRQFFRSIPKELDEAAEIDGCGSFGIFFRILLPAIKPAMTTVGIMSLIFFWNDFLGPLIYLQSESLYTLSIGLQFLNAQLGVTQIHLLMAVSVVSILPLITLFFAAQRYFVQGITVTGLKG